MDNDEVINNATFPMSDKIGDEMDKVFAVIKVNMDIIEFFSPSS